MKRTLLYSLCSFVALFLCSSELHADPAITIRGQGNNTVTYPSSGNLILAPGQFWTFNNGTVVGGGGSGGNVSTTGSNRLNFATSANTNITIPGNGTMAETNINQVWTGIPGFSAGAIILNPILAASSSNSTTLTIPDTGNYNAYMPSSSGNLLEGNQSASFLMPHSGNTFTLPGASSLLAALNVAETFTANQTFNGTAIFNTAPIFNSGATFTGQGFDYVTTDSDGGLVFIGTFGLGWPAINAGGQPFIIQAFNDSLPYVSDDGIPKSLTLTNSTLVGGNQTGVITKLTLGANLSITGNVLDSTGGGSGGNVSGNKTVTLNMPSSGLVFTTPASNTTFAGLGTTQTFTGANTLNGTTTFNTAPTGPNITINATNTQIPNAASVYAALPPGLTSYNGSASYTAGRLVIGSDNNYYRAIASTTGNDPTTDSGSNWQLYAALSNVSLSVPSRFSDIVSAMTFIQSATISASDLVIIQVANGNYSYGNTTINLQHPYGNQIQILGNLTSPASVIINSTINGSIPGPDVSAGLGLFYLNNGGSFGLIDGFTLNGPGVATSYGFGAIWAKNNANINLGPNMYINNFYFDIYVGDGSYVSANFDHLTGGGDGNFFVYNNSGASFVNGTSTGANTYFAMSGMVIEHGSSVFAIGANLSNNAGRGAFVDNTSSANFANATFNNNTIGPMHISSSSIDVTGATWAGNGNGNVPILDGVAALVRTGASSPANFGASAASFAPDISVGTTSDYILTLSGGSTNGRGDLELDSPSGVADPAVGFRLGGVFKAGIYLSDVDSSLRVFSNGSDRLTISTAGLLTIPGAANFGSTVTASGNISGNFVSTGNTTPTSSDQRAVNGATLIAQGYSTVPGGHSNAVISSLDSDLNVSGAGYNDTGISCNLVAGITYTIRAAVNANGAGTMGFQLSGSAAFTASNGNGEFSANQVSAMPPAFDLYGVQLTGSSFPLGAISSSSTTGGTIRVEYDGNITVTGNGTLSIQVNDFSTGGSVVNAGSILICTPQ